MRSKLGRASAIEKDDWVHLPGVLVRVDRITNAQGRKPPRGSNLHFHTALGQFTFNSEDFVRFSRTAPMAAPVD